MPLSGGMENASRASASSKPAPVGAACLWNRAHAYHRDENMECSRSIMDDVLERRHVPLKNDRFKSLCSYLLHSIRIGTHKTLSRFLTLHFPAWSSDICLQTPP